MPITLNFTTINNCDATTGFIVIGSGAGLAGGQGGQNGVPAKEGTGTVEFHLGANSSGGYRTPTVTSFDVRDFEVGAWFLNPKFNNAGAEMIASADNGVSLRLYSGANWADYYQPQWRLADGTWQGGWIYLRASGAAGTEDANSGTWTNTQAAAVDSVGIVVNSAASNTGKNDLEYQMDWFKYYDKVEITGTNTGSPWTLDDIVTESLNNVWGVVNKTDTFYEFFAGIEFGDAVATTTTFKAENEYIFLNQSSADHDYQITVKNGATVTFGAKSAQAQGTYAKNGIQLVVPELAVYQPATSPPKCAPSLIAESGGILQVYGTLVQGFGTINLGSGGTAAIDIVKSDFYDNDTIEFRSTGLTADNVRIHTDSTDKQDLGTVYNFPSSMKNIRVFNCVDALEFRAGGTVTNYIAGDTTRDALILEGQTLTLKNSTFSETKLERTT